MIYKERFMREEGNDFKVVLFEWRFVESLYKYTLALHYLSAVLREAGFTVFDYIFENSSKEYIVNKILARRPQLVGIHFYCENAPQIFSIARQLKTADPQLKIVLGGHTATLYPVKLLKAEPAIDLIVYGEGERTIVDLAGRMKDGESIKQCKGIFYRQEDLIIRNPPRELIEDLDSLPFPVIDVLRDNHGIKDKVVFSAIDTSRGCMGNCSFCITNRVFDSAKNLRWRGRKPESVANEIENLIKAFPDKRIVTRFIDGSFEDPDPKEKRRLTQIMDLIERRNLRFAFTFLSRAESWRAEDIPLIKRMKRLGLYEVAVGFEGSTAHALKVLNKRATIEDNERAYRLFKDCGVFVFGFLIMFHPYATFEELRLNAEFLKKMGMAYQPQAWWSELDLFPDARLFSQIVQDGLLLGPDEQGYKYRFAFVDGAVARVHKALNKIRDAQSHMAYRESIEKIKLEILLYDVWNQYDDTMAKISVEMAAYQKLFQTNCEQVGLAQYQLFIKLLDMVHGASQSEIDELMQNWDRVLQAGHIELEKDWVRYRMQFGRKKVLLI
jgi:anaerobic magnesium-protoporphyrin IX monomethyl ester cyclase